MQTGRTARIGNEGLATSFYNDKDSELAPDLVKILIESKQKIPDFLEQYRPAGDVATFDEDDTDHEDNAENGTGDDFNANNGDTGDAWGAPAADPPASVDAPQDDWGWE